MTQPTPIPGFKVKVEEPQDQQSPLVRFRGTLKEWQALQGTNEDGSQGRVRIKFDFTDVQVIESTEPYSHPIATLYIGYSERAQTNWAVFTKSLRDIVPMDVLTAADQPLDLLVGKTQEWYFADVKLRRPGREGDPDEKEWKMRDAKSWTIASCDGYGVAAGGKDIMEHILEFTADPGKTDTEIYQWMYTHMPLKQAVGYTSALEAVGERTLLSGLVAAGKLKESGDKYVTV